MLTNDRRYTYPTGRGVTLRNLNNAGRLFGYAREAATRYMPSRRSIPADPLAVLALGTAIPGAKRLYDYAFSGSGSTSKRVKLEEPVKKKSMQYTGGTADIVPGLYVDRRLSKSGYDWEGPSVTNKLATTIANSSANQTKYNAFVFFNRANLKTILASEFSYLTPNAAHTTQEQYVFDLDEAPVSSSTGPGDKKMFLHYYYKDRFKNNFPGSVFVEVALYHCISDCNDSPTTYWKQSMENAYGSTTPAFLTNPAFNMFNAPNKIFDGNWVRSSRVLKLCLKPGQESSFSARVSYVGNPYDDQSSTTYCRGCVMVMYRILGDLEHDSGTTSTVGIADAQIDILNHRIASTWIKDGLFVAKKVNTNTLPTVTTPVEENVDK